MNIKPQIVMESNEGFHNINKSSTDRLINGNTYKDLSTVCIVPIVGANIAVENGKVINVPLIHAKIVQNWMGLMQPMNQKFTRIFMMNMTVDDAYNSAIESILAHPDLKNWKYILTLETDNMPPPDGLMKLYEAINSSPTKDGKPYDVAGGLYWTKGECGQPMIYGNPKDVPLNFIPQVPIPDTIQHCNGLGMGFNLFRLDMFKDTKLRKPWFKTQQEFIPNVGVKCYTQDLFFYENAGKNGYTFCCNTKCKVGHYDIGNDMIW
jgi:hypothetical protein